MLNNTEKILAHLASAQRSMEAVHVRGKMDMAGMLTALANLEEASRLIQQNETEKEGDLDGEL